MLITPCCTAGVTDDLAQLRQLVCPLCAVHWTVAIRQDVWHWVCVSWTPMRTAS